MVLQITAATIRAPLGQIIRTDPMVTRRTLSGRDWLTRQLMQSSSVCCLHKKKACDWSRKCRRTDFVASIAAQKRWQRGCATKAAFIPPYQWPVQWTCPAGGKDLRGEARLEGYSQTPIRRKPGSRGRWSRTGNRHPRTFGAAWWGATFGQLRFV